MAKLEVNLPDGFLSGLIGTDFDELAEEALKASAPLLEESMKASCRRVLEHGEESELVSSIRSDKPRRTRTGAWIVRIGPEGYSHTKAFRGVRKARRQRVANALKMMAKEYGVAGRQPARPFLTRACNDVREAVTKRMQEAYSRKVGGDGSE